MNQAMRHWRGPQLPGSLLTRRVAPRSFDPNQLAIGVKVELEHTGQPELAMEIAMAHLTERGDYYELLEKMERSPSKRGIRTRR